MTDDEINLKLMDFMSIKPLYANYGETSVLIADSMASFTDNLKNMALVESELERRGMASDYTYHISDRLTVFAESRHALEPADRPRPHSRVGGCCGDRESGEATMTDTDVDQMEGVELDAAVAREFMGYGDRIEYFPPMRGMESRAFIRGSFVDVVVSKYSSDPIAMMLVLDKLHAEGAKVELDNWYGENKPERVWGCEIDLGEFDETSNRKIIYASAPTLPLAIARSALKFALARKAAVKGWPTKNSSRS